MTATGIIRRSVQDAGALISLDRKLFCLAPRELSPDEITSAFGQDQYVYEGRLC